MPSTWNVSILLVSTVYLLSTSASAEQRYVRARRYYPEYAALQARQTAFVGGWALRALQCPTEYTKCEQTRGVPTCCPTNTVCTREGYQNMPICCAKGEECFTTVQAVPICADPNWVLWKGPSEYSDDPFCCQQGEIGYVTNVSGRFPACGPSDLEIEATQKATTLRPATARAGDSTVIPKSSATGTTSSTSTSSSSQGSNTSLTSQGTNSGSNPMSSSSSGSDDPSSPGSTNSTTQSGSSSGLSTGVLVGVIVGVVVVLVILALLIFLVIRMRRRNALLAAQVAAANAGTGAAPAYNSSDVKPVHQEAYKPALASTTAVGSERGGYFYGSGSTGDELDGREVPTVRPNVPEMDAGRRGY